MPEEEEPYWKQRQNAAREAVELQGGRGKIIPPEMTPEQQGKWEASVEGEESKRAEESWAQYEAQVTPKLEEYAEHRLTGGIAPSPVAAQAMGETALSVAVPPAGWALDARDLQSAIDQRDPLMAAAAGIGFLPGLGDVAKRAFKSIRGGTATADMLQTGKRALNDAAQAKALWKRMGTESPYFKKWSGGAPVVKTTDKIPDGPVIIEGFHGTTELISEFRVPGSKDVHAALRGGLPGTQSAGRALYFSRDLDIAERYAEGWPPGKTTTLEYRKPGPNDAPREHPEFDPKEAERGVYPVYIKMDSPLDLSKKIKDSPDELHKLKQILEEIQARDLEVARRLDSAEGAKSNWEKSVHFNTDDRLMMVSALTGSPDAVKYKIAIIEDKLDRHSDFLDTPLEDVSYHDAWFWHRLQEYTEELEALKRRDPEVLRELYDPEQYIQPSISGGMSGQAEADDLSLGILFGDDGLFVTPNDVSDIFKKHGYDGIISDPEWNLPEVIIFEPKNVKSKFNKGTFEVDNPDIHASLAGAFDDPDVAYG